jgi:ribulose-phosphate 3-epimerase
MRHPMIPNKTAFSVMLIKRLYEILHERIPLAIHLMVKNPFPILWRINKFIEEDRHKTTIFIQRESYRSEEETVKALSLLEKYGYDAGICINLPTPFEDLTSKIAQAANEILIMSVPMGCGGQKYSKEATKRIEYAAKTFSGKTIWVDGGINQRTILEVWKAGAKVAVVGSFIIRNKEPKKALKDLLLSVEGSRNSL